MSPRRVLPGFVHLCLIAAPTLVSGVLAAPSASADPQPSGPPAPLPMIQDGTLVGSAYGAPGTVRGSILTEFLLTSREGDHHIERIAVESGGPSFVAFHNKSQDNCAWTEWLPGLEPACATSNTKNFYFDWRVGSYLRLNATRVTKAVTCEGSCTVPIADPPAGFAFVLSGFSVSYDNDNKFVRRLSVLPYSSPGKLTMRFHDNGSPKFKGAMYGAFLLASRLKVAKKEATLEYTPGKPAPKLDVGYDAVALVGFDFEFLNGDHKLKTIGIKYERPYLIPKFADQNTDDPWRVKIQYAVLKN